MYRPAAYAIAQTVVDIPLVLIQVLLFDIIIYWMAGLAATASQFFISVLTLWLVTMTTYAFFRAISAVMKTLDDATKVTGVAIQILVVYTGYLIPPSQMHPWFACKWSSLCCACPDTKCILQGYDGSIGFSTASRC